MDAEEFTWRDGMNNLLLGIMDGMDNDFLGGNVDMAGWDIIRTICRAKYMDWKVTTRVAGRDENGMGECIDGGELMVGMEKNGRTLCWEKKERNRARSSRE